MTTTTRSIAQLNDDLRAHFLPTRDNPGRVTLSRGIAALDADALGRVARAVATFDAFTPANDPYAEHDCAILTVDDARVLFKFSYYENAEMASGAEDGGTCYRVLTIMLAEEY